MTDLPRDELRAEITRVIKKTSGEWYHGDPLPRRLTEKIADALLVAFPVLESGQVTPSPTASELDEIGRVHGWVRMSDEELERLTRESEPLSRGAIAELIEDAERYRVRERWSLDAADGVLKLLSERVSSTGTPNALPDGMTAEKLRLIADLVDHTRMDSPDAVRGLGYVEALRAWADALSETAVTGTTPNSRAEEG